MTNLQITSLLVLVVIILVSAFVLSFGKKDEVTHEAHH